MNFNSSIFRQLYVINSSEISIQNLNFEDTNYGLTIYSCENTSLTNIIVVNCLEALRIEESLNITIKNSIISSCKVGIYVSDTDNSSIINNTVSENDDGIIINYSDYAVVLNNSCTFNGEGIRITNCKDVIISWNNISGNTMVGLNLGYYNCNVTFNLFLENLGYAIWYFCKPNREDSRDFKNVSTKS